MEPICNIDLDTLHTLDELESRNDLTNRPNLERLHVLDDLQEMDGSAPQSQESRGTPPRLFLAQYLLYIWPLFPASRT